LIATDTDELCGSLARMIACDTSFPPGASYPAFATLMEELLMPLGLPTRRVLVPDPLWQGGGARGARVNLIAGAATGQPVCSIYFHTDTVPPGDGWTRPPLALTRAEGRLYGRGTADMKGSIAAVLAALRAARRHEVELEFDPVLLFCTDEEGGLYPGIRYLAEQGLVDGHLLSFNGGAVPRIWAGCFGSFDLLVTIAGRAAHSGDPGDGINAIEAALPLLNALAALKPVVEARLSALPPPPHHHGRALHGRLTVAAAHGGQKGSSLPASFSILINRRYAPEEDFGTALSELNGTIETALTNSPALGHHVELIGHLAPVSDPTGPHWPRWQAALCEGFGFTQDNFSAWGSSTSSDMGWVQRAGITEILLGGLSRPDNNVHGADEFTTEADLVALARSVLAYLAKRA
jgi:succinyl-diaminopimelate desuccinylase